METKTEWIIDGEGKMFRRDITNMELDPGDGFQRVFSKGQIARFRNLMEIPGHGKCHMVYELDTGMQYWSIPMKTINFRTTFGVKGEDLYPTFKPAESPEPVLEIEWDKEKAMAKQDSTMNIQFIAIVKFDGVGYYVSDHYLFTFDGRSCCWRLPIANLYDTCQICMGEYSSFAVTAYDAVQKALAQFRKASWNADLFFSLDIIHQFVRFKALEKGFETLPIIGGWTTHCSKISTAMLKYIEV